MRHFCSSDPLVHVAHGWYQNVDTGESYTLVYDIWGSAQYSRCSLKHDDR